MNVFPLKKLFGGKYITDDHICADPDWETKNVVTVADEVAPCISAPELNATLQATVTDGASG